MLWLSVFLHLSVCGGHGRADGQGGRGAGDKMTASGELRCSSSSLQLALCLIRMEEITRGGGGERAWRPTSLVRDSALCLSKFSRLGNQMWLVSVMDSALLNASFWTFYHTNQTLWAPFPPAVFMTRAITSNCEHTRDKKVKCSGIIRRRGDTWQVRCKPKSVLIKDSFALLSSLAYINLLYDVIPPLAQINNCVKQGKFIYKAQFMHKGESSALRNTHKYIEL